ncbi:MAG: hypothetical protein FJ217_11595 [Ignavibacteria bacterium]|nr:hypothetical protein [Ignavibacteria bacterium]
MLARIAAAVFLCVGFLSGAHGQTAPARDTARVRYPPDLENVLEQVTLDAEDSQLIDLLARLQEDPLDVNSASVEELQQVPGISSILAFNIVAHRSKTRFNDLDDLLLVGGMTSDLLLRVRPFVRVGGLGTRIAGPVLTRVHLRTRASEDLERRRGFEDGTFQGSPLKLYSRLTAGFVIGDIKRKRPNAPGGLGEASSVDLGIVTEKDAGERKMTDFIAGYVAATIPSISTRFILGDFAMESAEGLVFWRSAGLSKSTEVIASVRKNGVGIRPYLSTNENWYFRGMAAEASMDWVNVTLMYSDKPMHGTRNDEGVITNFDNSGLFRTASELSRRNQTRERLFGGRLSATPVDGMKVGMTGYQARFTDAVELSSVSRLLGRTAAVVGWDVSYTQRWFNIFAELARDHDNSTAGVAGILLKPHETAAVSCAVRSFPERYVSLHSNVFGESGGVARNESGAYIGLALRPISGFSLSLYYDQFRFPWKSSSSLFPAAGHDVLAFSEMRLSARLSLQLQYKEKRKNDLGVSTDALGREMRVDEVRTQRNYRATVELVSSRAFRWRSRVELVSASYSDSRPRQKGALVFQDIRFFPLPRFLIDARVIAFQTDSYDSRVYEFESELSGTLYNPALYGRGLRWYLLARLEVTPAVDLSVKYSQTLKDGVKKIGSGSGEILGDRERRASVQMDVRF